MACTQTRTAESALLILRSSLGMPRSLLAGRLVRRVMKGGWSSMARARARGTRRGLSLIREDGDEMESTSVDGSRWMANRWQAFGPAADTARGARRARAGRDWQDGGDGGLRAGSTARCYRCCIWSVGWAIIDSDPAVVSIEGCRGAPRGAEWCTVRQKVSSRGSRSLSFQIFGARAHVGLSWKRKVQSDTRCHARRSMASIGKSTGDTETQEHAGKAVGAVLRVFSRVAPAREG